MKQAWVYLVLGAVLVYWLWELHVDATVGIDSTSPVNIHVLNGQGADQVNWALVDELPVGA